MTTARLKQKPNLDRFFKAEGVKIIMDNQGTTLCLEATKNDWHSKTKIKRGNGKNTYQAITDGLRQLCMDYLTRETP
jgi:hypothetical protein